MMPDQVRRLARRRAFAALAALVSPFVPLLGFGLICSALVLYVRPEAISGQIA